jgi:hypothetical protein
MSEPSVPGEIRDLHAFVLELGRALSLAGTAVSETQDRLRPSPPPAGRPQPASSFSRRR